MILDYTLFVLHSGPYLFTHSVLETGPLCTRHQTSVRTLVEQDNVPHTCLLPRKGRRTLYNPTTKRPPGSIPPLRPVVLVVHVSVSSYVLTMQPT